jgi:hypothetical protein
MSTWHEKQLIEELSSSHFYSDLVIEENTTEIFASIYKAFPIIGSKINWAHVVGSIHSSEPNLDLQIQRWLEFFDNVDKRFDLPGEITIVGDGVIDFGITGTKTAIRSALSIILTFPQHHYLLGGGNRALLWCMCFSAEGDMDFGFSVKS